jgi:ApeA N-terminal domain 1
VAIALNKTRSLQPGTGRSAGVPDSIRMPRIATRDTTRSMARPPPFDTPLLGRFWLDPEEADASCPGVLALGKNGASIQVEGTLSGFRLLSDAVVFGRLTEDDKAVTLFNCFGGTTYRGQKPIHSRVECTLAVFGRHSKDLRGDGIEFRLPGSEAWFHEQMFDVQHDTTGGEVTVRYRDYEEFRYRISESLSLVRAYRGSVQFGNWGTERFEATRTLFYRLLNEGSVSFDELWNLTVRFRRMLVFFAQRPMEQSDVAILAVQEGEQYQSMYPVHRSTLYPIPERKFEWDDQLLRYDEMQDRFEGLLARWFSVYDQQPEPFERFFSAFERGHLDVVLHFLWVIAAVEELHKVRNDRRKMDLIDRLKDLRERWRDAMQPSPPDEALEAIKDSRHYYAHAAGDLRERAASDWRLLRYSHFLAAIFHLEVLSLLGFGDQEITAIATGRYWMRESLGLRMFPLEP